MGVGLFLLWVGLVTLLRDNLGARARVFNDYADRADYFVRGSWLPTDTVPYRDVPSEYPQIPTFIFGILYLPILGRLDPAAYFTFYSALFSFLMLCLYLGLAAMLDRLLPADKKALVWTLLLPAPLYFAYNRFDVLPALIVTAALLMVRDEKWELTALLIGIGTLTKWYPALLVVPVVAYMRSRNAGIIRVGSFLVVFGATILGILAPTYLTGGVPAVLSPYVRLGVRGVDMPALPVLLEPLTRNVFAQPIGAASLRLFIALEFIILPIVLLARIDTFERFLGWSLLALAVFMLFSPLYSPQWILWIIPFMILLARRLMDTVVLITYGTITYFEYPILHTGYGTNPTMMTLLGWMNVVCLVWIIVRVVKALRSAQQTLVGEPDS